MSRSSENAIAREWDSASYHRLSDHQFDWGIKVLDRVPARGNEIVLDAGCGTGRITAELLKRIPHGQVIAVDLSENMLRSARENLKSQFAGRVAFICADLQQLPFREQCDGIFSTATFHWVKDHPRLFASLYSVLTPGGWLAAQCGGGPNLARLRARAAEMLVLPKYAHYFKDWVEPWEFATADVTAERLRSAGFVEVKTWTEPAGFVLPDEDTFRQYLATVTFHRHLERITDLKLRDEFLVDMARQSHEYPDLAMDYWRLNINARKPARVGNY
jgi:trans-aconitate 2-methyltransferase